VTDEDVDADSGGGADRGGAAPRRAVRATDGACPAVRWWGGCSVAVRMGANPDSLTTGQRYLKKTGVHTGTAQNR